MQLPSGLYLALLGWQIYTPIHSSPLSPALSAVDFTLVPGALSTLSPTASVVSSVPEALSTFPPPPPSNSTNATLLGDFPPTEPYVIRLEGSTISVQFWARHYLKENRVQQVLQAAQVDSNHHQQTTPMFKSVPTRYQAGKTSLTVPYLYSGILLWSQWTSGLAAVRLYMQRFDWLGCEFEMFDHTVNRWYNGGRLMSDYGTALNETVAAALNETATAAE